MDAPGPACLGRGVVVVGGAPVPPAWAGRPEVLVDDAVLDAPAAAVSALHEAWVGRRPLVVRLAVDPARFRAPFEMRAEPWTLDPDLELWTDRLHHLVWANTYDARGDEVVWWWGRKAARLGARPAGADEPGDVVLPDGRPAWVDGGPRRALGPVEGAVVLHAESVEEGVLTVVPEPREPLADLAPDQLEAVSHGSGPARVLAPAGSGKTRVLTERLRHLLVDRAYERAQVLAVAYNVKARDQLVERTADVRPRVQTLNGLGLWVVREAAGRAPEVLDERDVRRLVERLLPGRRARRANTDPIAPYVEALAEVRLGLRDPAVVERERDDVPGLAALFPAYRARLRERGAVDFDEQVYRAVEELLADGALRRRLQARCRHLLVDEFQDLTPCHVLLVRLLSCPGFDVFGVGDDDQVIYGHAGADPRFLVDYDRFFPGAATHALEVNYRCPVAVVGAARNLLSHNRRRVDKVIRAGPGAREGDQRLRVEQVPAGTMGTALTTTVRGWLDAGASPGEVAVLARVNSALLAPHVALAEAGVPVASALDHAVLQRVGVRAALAYLRLATAEGGLARADLVEVYRRPSRGMPEWIQKWFHEGMDHDDLRRAAAKIDDGRVSDKLLELADDLAVLTAQARAGATTRGLLLAIRNDIGLGGAMDQLDRSKGREGTSQLDDLDALVQVADLHPDPAGFDAWLERILRRPDDADGVVLATVHKVKGREWPYVVLFGVSEGLLPHRLASDVEEERRVLHVGITRAIGEVVLLADRARPSPLLAELDAAGPAPPRTSPPSPVAAAARGASVTTAAEDEEADALFEVLRAWRTERARRDAVPPYVVFHDAHLRAVAKARPVDLTALAGVPGVGPARLERYGEEIVAVVRRHLP